jgi:uncharacterized membrane protein SirB2
VEHIFTLFFHFVGIGLLVTTMTAGYILNRQYKKAGDYQTKAIILRSMKPIGMLSPVASLLLLITGIGNMHSLGFSILELPGWLAYKIIFYSIALISGVLFAVKSRKRAMLVGQIAAGKAPADAENTLKSFDQQIGLFYPVLAILFTIIVLLSITGRLGAQ